MTPIPEETLALARRWLTNSPGPTPTMPTDEEVEGLAIFIEQTRDIERQKWLIIIDKQRERMVEMQAALRELVNIDCYAGNDICRAQANAMHLVDDDG